MAYDHYWANMIGTMNANKEQAEREKTASAVATDAATTLKAAEFALEQARRAETAPRRLNERAQADALERARRELSSEEGSWLGRLSPRRNLWPELARLDEEIARLDGASALALAECQALEQELRDAEEQDRVALAGWHSSGGSGQRPQATAPAVAEALERRRADADPLPAAAAAKVSEKVEFVVRNRTRLVKRADERVSELAEHYSGLLAQLEACREDLLAARSTSLWARLFPAQSAAHEVPTALALGLAKPVVEAFGHSLRVEPARLWNLLRIDAELIPTATSAEQKLELDGPDPHDPRSATWAGSAEAVERERADRAAALERLRG